MRFYELDYAAGFVEVGPKVMDTFNPLFTDCPACRTLIPIHARTLVPKSGSHKMTAAGAYLCRECSSDYDHERARASEEGP